MMKVTSIYHILVVEDDPDQRILFTCMLSRHGFTVTSANDGEVALELLSSGLFDLLLTDWQLPGLLGDELILRARERHPTMKALLMSTGCGLVQAAQACQADGYIQKGDVLHLISVVKLHLGMTEHVGVCG